MTTATLQISAKRFKGGTWALYITYPDGSYEHRRGMVDDGEVASAIDRALAKIERDASSIGQARP